MSARAPHVVVIGAGIAGLAAARALLAAGVSVTVLERAAEPGGRVRTLQLDGSPVDVGAQFVAAFCRETLRAGRPEAGLQPFPPSTAVVRDRVGRRVGRPLDLLRGELLSPSSRVRLPGLAVLTAIAWHALDPADLASGRRYDRRSASDLARRWAGEETATYLLDPLVRGLLYWDLETTSQAVLLAMLKAAVRGPALFRPVEGMQRLVAAVAGPVEVRTGVEVTAVHPSEGGYLIATRGDEDPVRTDGVVCAATAPDAAALVAGLSEPAARLLASIAYSRTMVSVYRVADGRPLPETSRLFPAPESPLLASVNPPQGVLAQRSDRHVRVCLSDHGFAALEDLDDESVAARALAAVRGCDADALWTDGARHVGTVRWERALPRFSVGYLRSEVMDRDGVLDLGRVVLAGDYLRAPHLEGALVSGQVAAGRLLERL